MGPLLLLTKIDEQNISNANVYGGSVALGDVNNDGRIDIAISGADNSGYGEFISIMAVRLIRIIHGHPRVFLMEASH